eukprot:gene1459-2806_t
MENGGKYSDLKGVVFIAIMDFIMFPHKSAYISTHTIRDIDTNEHDLNILSFSFIELAKYQKHDTTSGIEEWYDLLKFTNDYKAVKTSNPVIQKAYKSLEMANWTEDELMNYQADKKLMFDNQSILEQARKEAYEEAFEEAYDEAFKEAYEEAFVKYYIKNTAKIAKEMKDMNIDMDTIVDVTCLSEDEINQL